MKKLILILAGLCTAAVLTACGGGGGSSGTGTTAKVAASNTTVAIDATNGQAVTTALAGTTLTFPNGVADFGTTGSTTVLFSSPNGFQITSGGSAASGTTSFGSIHFQVTSSSFTSGPLVQGNTVTINNVTLTLLTAGVPADGASHTVEVQLTLNGTVSAIAKVSVQILSTGAIVINNITVGTVTLTPVTGA